MKLTAVEVSRTFTGRLVAVEEPSKLALGLAWRFRLLERAGGGATSHVYRAFDRMTERAVALKVGVSEESAAIFAAEASWLSRGESPNIPELIDLGRVPEGSGAESGKPYLAMTWAPGNALTDLGERPEHERCAIACAVARDIGEALATLHDAGVAHGDVKLANIHLVEDGEDASPSRWRAHLVDLGLAGDASADTPEGGTLRYLPPELWSSGRGGDARARDRFALGLVLAEVLAPELRSVSNLVERARAQRLPSPFQGWCHSLLARDPGARARASWVAQQARLLAGARETAEEARERCARRMRAAYLGSREVELRRAIRAEQVEVRVSGAPGAWLTRAIELGRRARQLKGERPSPERLVIDDADALTRARWLVSLVGSAAAGWPLARLRDRSDAAYARALESLADRAPESWTLADVERAFEGTRASAHDRSLQPFESPVTVALALSTGDRLRAIEAIESGAFSSPPLVRGAADALRRMGEAGRALALLADDADPAAHSLRAEIARRAGDVELALNEANAALAHDGQDARAHATLARIRIDRGGAREALEGLLGAPAAAATLEAKAIALVSCGERAAALRELTLAETLASTEEERGRTAGLVGYVAHLSGDAARAGAAYATASRHAERAGALVEEATYLSGEAACAVDRGDVARGLEAARRASLLWEHLGRPADAARALLARGAAFSLAGARLEALALAREARERGQALGDALVQAFACWIATDVLEPEHVDAEEPARFAYRVLGDSPVVEHRLRALARVVRHVPTEIDEELLRWGDMAAGREDMLVAARLEWWRARAERFSVERGVAGAETIVLEVCHLATQPAALAARGPALAAAGALAAKLGDGNAVRLLSRAQVEAANTLLDSVPADLRESATSVPWVQSAHAAPAVVSAEQIAEFEALMASLGTRDRLRPLLEQALDSLILWTGAERGLLLLPAPSGKLVARAARNLTRHDLEGEQRRLSHSLALKAIELGQPIVAADAAGEMPSMYASVHALKLRSVLAVPLVARGQTLGVAYLDDRMRRGAFGPRELAWVKLVASLAAIAIADARDQILLRRMARRAERAQQALARELSRREAELELVGRELARSREGSETRFAYETIVGRSQPMTAMLRVVDRVTLSSVPVLLIGESGSGKELIARAIHANGARGGETFVAENCAAIPELLLESTLFGHARGAFTGADRARVGLFEVAHGGTLLLDEVGEMSLAMQAKLLRVLEQGEIRPLGSEKCRQVDVRVIAATHRDLEKMVEQGTFRQDLFYRLNVITIRVPPLRERPDDIPLLVQRFIEKHAPGRALRVSKAALSCLRRYSWPGNVRQLENEVRRAIVLSDDLIDLEHLSIDVQKSVGDPEAAVGLRIKPRVDALEAELVRRALVESRGNQTRAAEKLGVSRFGLQKMIKRLAIKVPA